MPHLPLAQLLIVTVIVLCSYPVKAQSILPDNAPRTTLDTQVLSNNSHDFRVVGGRTAGNNLYHSFSEFSLPSSGSVTFDLLNSPNITNIFSRVLGRRSDINGAIRTINEISPVNLFLINPQGITWGANAELDLSGSFVATTGDQILFSDAVTFSSVQDVANNTLLSVNVPTGIQLGSASGTIRVNGAGHRLTSLNRFTPINLGTSTSGLSVQPDQTVALIGRGIFLDGGIVNANQGSITIASIDSGLINITAENTGWGFDDSKISNFQDLSLTNQSLLNASGLGTGSISISAQDIAVDDGSVVLIQNQGTTAAGDIDIRATQTVEIVGTTPDELISSSLRNETISVGNGGNILIKTHDLTVSEGARISTGSYFLGQGGNIDITATGNVDILNVSPVNRLASFVASESYSIGNAGNLSLGADSLQVVDGANIGTIAFGSGNAGNFFIDVANAVSVSGFDPLLLQPSAIASVTTGDGNAGNLVLNATTLNVLSGGRVDTSTVANGSAGYLEINVSDTTTVSGKILSSSEPSQIISSADILEPGLQQLFGAPSLPGGRSGDLVLTTNRLIINDGAVVGVQNEGTGNAGNLSLNSPFVEIDNQSKIEAATRSGEGGNIDITSKLLYLENNSQITSTAGGSGNGGNIFISAPVILGLGNSDIMANAFQGSGGNIQISTQGIIGLQFRSQLTTDNDITASSQFGVDGNVAIVTPNVNSLNSVFSLPNSVLNTADQISTACSASEKNSFVLSGRGGVPNTPMELLPNHSIWFDVRLLEDITSTPSLNDRASNHLSTIHTTNVPINTFEANSAIRNEDGLVTLINVSAAEYTLSQQCIS